MGADEYKWHVAYTNPRAEKKVYDLLSKKNIQVYLPLAKTLKQWADRKKWVEEPLFKSYIFVKISEKEYLDVLNTQGVVRYISFSGEAAIMRDEQVETMKRILASETELEPVHHEFKKGEQVRITAGPLTGLCGELVSFRSEKKFLVRIDNLDQSILLNISQVYLEPDI